MFVRVDDHDEALGGERPQERAAVEALLPRADQGIGRQPEEVQRGRHQVRQRDAPLRVLTPLIAAHPQPLPVPLGHHGKKRDGNGGLVIRIRAMELVDAVEVFAVVGHKEHTRIRG